MRAHICLDNHPVYQSLFKTLGYIKELRVLQLPRYDLRCRYILKTKTFHIQNLDVGFSRGNLYVINSPLIALEAWKARFQGIPSIYMEEYFSKSWLKDRIVTSLLLLFKNYPFIASTKRTHTFLVKNGFCSFLIPPSERKIGGRKKRDIILYVGRMVESKNPLFVLEIAERMKNEHFIMIGHGPLSVEIKKKAKSLQNVEIIDFVETRKKLFEHYYSRAKLLLHPAYNDPIGFVVIEALSTSTPVLASASVGASDYLPREWVFKGYKTEEWIEKIKGIDNNATELAAETFKKENLCIDGPYFRQKAEELKNFISKKGWLR